MIEQGSFIVGRGLADHTVRGQGVLHEDYNASSGWTAQATLVPLNGLVRGRYQESRRHGDWSGTTPVSKVYQYFASEAKPFGKQ